MFEALSDAISEVQRGTDPRALRAALALHNRLGAAISAAIGDFDERRLWDLDAATSMKMWLVDEGLAPQDAHRRVLDGRRMRQLPVLAAAWLAGDLSSGQVRVIVDVVVDRHVSRFRDVEDLLVPALVGLSVKQTHEVMAEWRARADAVDDDEPSEPDLSLHHSQTFGGRYVTNGSFDADHGSIVATALATADSDDPEVPAHQRRAQALVTISRFFLDHHETTSAPRQRPHVSVVVNALDLSSGGGGWNPETGDRYDGATVSRYLCDCSLDRVVADKVAGAVSRVLDMGRSVRTATPAQRAALAVRDRGCRWPGCNARAAWCEAHHVRWYEHGGLTDLDNLVLLCGKHHHEVHRKRGLELKLLPDATVAVTYPNGMVRTTRPPGALDPLPLLE